MCVCVCSSSLPLKGIEWSLYVSLKHSVIQYGEGEAGGAVAHMDAAEDGCYVTIRSVDS